MTRVRIRPTGELAALQREVDSRRDLTFETFRERVRAVVRAAEAVRLEEEGAGPALRQAYVDVASVCLGLAEDLKPTRG